MKFAALATIAIVNAQDEAAAEGEAAAEAPVLAFGDACSLDAGTHGDCDSAQGLCCMEGIFEEDIVNGEMQEGYLENMISVCNYKNEGEFTQEDTEDKYWTSAGCIPVGSYAVKLATAATAVFTAAYMTQ